MRIEVNSLSKRFEYHFVVRDFNFIFDSGGKYGIAGPNGCGKSTLMKMISGFLSPSEGKVSYFSKGKEVSRSKVYERISFSAPYILPSEDFSLKEIFEFHFKLKPSKISNYSDLLSFLEWKDPKDKLYRNFSSGMKQKVSLALSLVSDTELILLDEPTSYLDSIAKQWFYINLKNYSEGKTLIIASNDKTDFSLCHRIIDHDDFCRKDK
mgnify:CR=1 FL=1